jgi:uncharacterized protein
MPPKLPWYDDGLRFQCTACGQCCTGEPGFVWVDDAEIAALAAALKMDVDKFEKSYVRRVGKKKSLVELTGGDCVFFDSRVRHCSLYDARPTQCRTWPFWHSNVRTPEAWEETCSACPGSGKGRLVGREQIEHRVAMFRL